MKNKGIFVQLVRHNTKNKAFDKAQVFLMEYNKRSLIFDKIFRVRRPYNIWPNTMKAYPSESVVPQHQILESMPN